MLKLKLQYFGHLMQRTDSLVKTLKDWMWKEKRVTEDDWLDGIIDSMEQTPGDSERLGNLEYWNSWGLRVQHDWETEQ